jgi:hypothetical protein
MNDSRFVNMIRACVLSCGYSDEGVSPREITRDLGRGDKPNIRTALGRQQDLGVAELVPAPGPQRWRLAPAYRAKKSPNPCLTWIRGPQIWRPDSSHKQSRVRDRAGRALFLRSQNENSEVLTGPSERICRCS